jgi:uncharacterized protein
MEFEQIIRNFAESDVVPVQAIHAALAASDQFVDQAAGLVGRVASGKGTKQEVDAICVLAHVLGEIGDRRAFAPLLALCMLPEEQIELMFGDSIGGSFGNILIALSEGKEAPAMQAVLESPAVYQFARDAVFAAWTYLALTGQVEREEAERFLFEYPVRLGLEMRDFGWSSWIDAVAALGVDSQVEFARKHLRSRKSFASLFDAPPATLEDFESVWAKAKSAPSAWEGDQRYQPFTDTVKELSGWYGYSEEYRARQAKGLENDDEGQPAGGSLFGGAYIAANPYKDVGRNDPCPCGSGKKFKKCCLIN